MFFKFKKNKIKKNLTKVFKIDKYGLIFYPITLLKLLEGDYFVPFQLFMIKQKGNGMWGQSQKFLDRSNNNEKTLELRKKKSIPLIKYVLESFIFNPEFNFEEFHELYGYNGIFEVFSLIVSNSLKYFNKQFNNIAEQNVLNIDFLCKRYGKTPIEILCKNKDAYNELDALFFNFFIGLTANNIEVEKANRAARK